MSSLTKNGIDHRHHDVHWGRYVGAECNIFIWRRHLQTKDPSRDNITAQYRNYIQVVRRNLGKNFSFFPVGNKETGINVQSCGKLFFAFTQETMNI